MSDQSLGSVSRAASHSAATVGSAISGAGSASPVPTSSSVPSTPSESRRPSRRRTASGPTPAPRGEEPDQLAAPAGVRGPEQRRRTFAVALVGDRDQEPSVGPVGGQHPLDLLPLGNEAHGAGAYVRLARGQGCKEGRALSGAADRVPS